MPGAEATQTTTLRELALLFLRLGSTSFGGPAAHVAMMQGEVVEKRNWLSREEFLDLVSATNFIPGPNSTELAIHIGHSRRGWPGLLVAGACFILPAALIVSFLAWIYLRYGSLPEVKGILYGIKPVIVAVIAQAVVSLGRSALRPWPRSLLGLVALAACLAGINELLILLLAGLCGWMMGRPHARKGAASFLLLPASLLLGGKALAAAADAAAPFALGKLFLFFLKVGSVLFGSGYVLVAFLRSDLVERWHWLSDAQLLDAIAVGQFTPGPVFTTATFIGYLLAGPLGALLATLGIFLPAFFFVGVSAPFLERLRRSPSAAGMLSGLNVASLAIMAAAGLFLAKEVLVDPVALGLAGLSLALLLRWRVNSAWLVLAGGVAGYVFSSGALR